MYRTMRVTIVDDITPRPLRTKADSVQKIVGYAGTGVMLVAISVMDVNPAMLFAYITAWECSWASPWPVPSTATPSPLTTSSAARRRPRPSRAGAGALAAGGHGSRQRT